jgi:gamma-glutamylcyclotransferase
MSRSQTQPNHDSPTTSSKTGTFYFAFGSNLSAHQMSIRLQHSPTSSIPVAIARLDSYAWIICERGYANVVAMPQSAAGDDTTTVWGVLYNMTAEDEARLDMYEGHNDARNPHPVRNPDSNTQHFKQFEQGGWDYNKHYLPTTVTKWLRDPAEYGVNVPSFKSGSSHAQVNGELVPPGTPTMVCALVYVDEFRTTPGEIEHEYIGRMNRGIEEAVKLGLPQAWVDRVMRKFIPPGIYVDDHGYVGTDEGYVEAKATETDDPVTEQMVREMSEKGEMGVGS